MRQYRFMLVSIIVLFSTHPQADNLAQKKQFTFAWPYSSGEEMAPRGGTTKGPALELDTEAGTQWAALQAEDISKFERDRRAILAMAGPYRASFDFVETVGFVLTYSPTAPYQSWGTEYVYILENNQTQISLQHILVMIIALPSGEMSEAHVVKHWRQDWHYEQRELYVYSGHNHWQPKTRTLKEVVGTWTQAVYQVDDTPRYAAMGEWKHTANYSTWESEETWRPLPRREFSVRDDYQVLIGTNRHSITPTGWIHEQENLKVRLDNNGNIGGGFAVLAKEQGFNRYERISNFDFTPGDNYWTQSSGYWRDVRNAWQRVFRDKQRIKLKKEVDGVSHISRFFGFAADINKTSPYDQKSGLKFMPRQ